MSLDNIVLGEDMPECQNWRTPVEPMDVMEKQSEDHETHSGLSKLVDWAFYAKQSIGKDAKPFKAYKFRTMKRNSDNMFLDIAEKEGLDEKGKLRNDPRITKTGRILRKYWIDELPQFYNVLKGDMKLVGVRPFEDHHWNAYPEDIKRDALKYKPGLFGVNYAFSNHSPETDGIGLMREYLKAYAHAPFKTDIKYFGRIMYNILFRNMRSS